MNISTLTLGALLTTALSAQSQTAYKDSLQTDTVKNSKTPAAQISDKYHQSQIQDKNNTPTTKGHKPRYCPTCGRG